MGLLIVMQICAQKTRSQCKVSDTLVIIRPVVLLFLYPVKHPKIDIKSIRAFVWKLTRVLTFLYTKTKISRTLRKRTPAEKVGWLVGWLEFIVPLSSEGSLTCHGHLRGPVTLTPVAERLAVELSLPVFTTQVCRDRGSNSDLPHARRTLYLYATTAVAEKEKQNIKIWWNPNLYICWQ